MVIKTGGRWRGSKQRCYKIGGAIAFNNGGVIELKEFMFGY